MITFCLGLLGGLALAFVSHGLTLNREARDRRHDFRGSLGKWLYKIRRVPEGDAVETYRIYTDYLEHLGGYRGRVARDFYRKKRFKILCDDLGSLLPEHLNSGKKECRAVVAEKIETLMDFV